MLFSSLDQFGFIVYFSIVPNRPGDQIFLDKIALTESGFFQHAISYFVLGAITFYTFKRQKIWRYLWGYFFVGIFFEIIQCSIPTRSFNIDDILANGLGLQAIAWVIYIKR